MRKLKNDLEAHPTRDKKIGKNTLFIGRLETINIRDQLLPQQTTQGGVPQRYTGNKPFPAQALGMCSPQFNRYPDNYGHREYNGKI